MASTCPVIQPLSSESRNRASSGDDNSRLASGVSVSDEG
jgi:hypothetical protein